MTKTTATKKTNKDDLTRAVTAFDSWDRLCDAINDRGYVPTLSSKKPAEAKLAKLLAASWLPVWDPSTHHNWPQPETTA